MTDLSSISWTPLSALHAAALFVLAGLFEIGGGWLVWQAIRSGKPWWWALLGGATLVGYGFVPTLQPPQSGNEFGRLDAAYGGVFIGMSFLWGRIFDGMKLDMGDLIGSLLCLAGVIVIMAWPRGEGTQSPCGGVFAACNATNTTTLYAHGTRHLSAAISSRAGAAPAGGTGIGMLSSAEPQAEAL